MVPKFNLIENNHETKVGIIIKLEILSVCFLPRKTLECFINCHYRADLFTGGSLNYRPNGNFDVLLQHFHGSNYEHYIRDKYIYIKQPSKCHSVSFVYLFL